MNLSRLTIAQKLWLPTIVIASLVAMLFAVTAWRTSSSIEADRQRQTTQAEKLEIALRWSGLTESNAARVVAGLLSPDQAVTEALKPEIEKTTKRISELQKRLEELSTDPEEKAALEVVAKTRKDYITVRNEATKAKADGDAMGALLMLNDKVRPAIDTYLKAQQAFGDLQQRRNAEALQAAADDRMRTVVVVSAVLLGATVLLVVTTFLLVRSIRTPLRDLVAHARRIGEGDLATPVTAQRFDEIGEVERALGEMQAALRRVVGEVRASSDSIRVASQEVATGNHDLSQRTEQTAGSLQQTASSMEQITGTVRQSADSAQAASQLAGEAAGIAQRGGEVVSRVVDTMQDINASSRRIADIIGVIDGIAFQTNILALNAAVEAARAGEQGRGFAVVAGEVRSLAQRSAEAAREIKSLIGASVDKVASGSQLVDEAGRTMGEIVASVQRVTDIIREISNAAGEQSAGLVQVNSAVTQLDQMTQQNAALVEQSAAAAESLREQAERLAQSIAGFRLAASGGLH